MLKFLTIDYFIIELVSILDKNEKKHLRYQSLYFSSNLCQKSISDLKPEI